MKGYEITFFTHEDRLHGTQQMSEWLMLTALDLGLRGTTVITGSEGYGHKFRIHSSQLFDPPDNPQEIVMIANEEETELLFDRLQKENVHLFYVKTPVEFGMLGESLINE